MSQRPSEECRGSERQQVVPAQRHGLRDTADLDPDRYQVRRFSLAADANAGQVSLKQRSAMPRQQGYLDS